MPFVTKSNRLIVLLAVLVAISALFTIVPFTPPAEAQSCTHGSTRWITIGCCACNWATSKKLQSCNNGVWTDTGYTQCFETGSCCRTPCCHP
ncbi:MAG TPA: hypothetical protein VG477_08220 [Thermoanaerobaculia bacterium]|nr:hypothetical protein [Thermoanaerobaculia bacterium]